MKQHEHKRYSVEELQEFEQIILERLEKAEKELKFIQEALSRKSDNNVEASTKLLEEVPDMIEKENLSTLIDRQCKYIVHLKNALARIRNGTYGICTVTGKLIDKERLKVVPHSRHSAAAKRAKEEQER